MQTYHNQMVQCIVVGLPVVDPDGPEGEAIAPSTLLDVYGWFELPHEGRGEVSGRGAVSGTSAGAGGLDGGRGKVVCKVKESDRVYI